MKPYAILILTHLRVAKFDTKDEWHDAIRTLKESETPFVILKYHNGTERYVIQEDAYA